MKPGRWTRESKTRRSCRNEEGRKITIVKRNKDLMKYRLYVSGRLMGHFNTLRDALVFLTEL